MEKVKKSPIDLEIGKVKKALIDFAKEVKSGENLEEKQNREKGEEITGK